MIVKAATLALEGIRHAFFTREGGVSGGLYASLNGGFGSRDDADHVAENRARMAAALGVEAAPFAHRLSNPFAATSSLPRRRGRPDDAAARRRYRDAHARRSPSA